MNEWERYQELVLSELRRLSGSLDSLKEDFQDYQVKREGEITALKVKSGLFGFFAGMLSAAINSLVEIFHK